MNSLAGWFKERLQQGFLNAWQSWPYTTGNDLLVCGMSLGQKLLIALL